MMHVTIQRVDSELRGVGRLESGKTVFVPFALPGEVVAVSPVEEKDRYMIARADEVLTPSALRMTADCPHYGTCGGCSGRHMQYEATLKFKQQIVYDALNRLGGVENPVVEETIGAENPLRNRNKVEFRILPGGKIGYHSNELGSAFPLTDCLLASEKMLDAARAAAKLCPRAQHVVIRTNRAGEMQLTVSGEGRFPVDAEALAKASGATSIHVCRLKNRPAHALDGMVETLLGAPKLRETIFGNQFFLSPQAFSQTDTVQADKLYGEALRYLDLAGGEKVLDAYSGAGTISLALAKKAGHVTGVEINPASVRNAKEAAELNELADKVDFVCADAVQFARENRARFDVAMVDPPRKGLDEAFTKALVAMRPEKIVYVSCNPATLARDIKRMAGKYRLVKARPVDMFPFTANIETVACLTRI